MLQTALCEVLRCDPLGQTTSLPLTARLFPLGFPLEIATNSEGVLEAAAGSWASYPEIFSAQPLHLRVAVATDGSTAVPPPPVCRGQQHLFVMISDAGNFAVGDYTSQFAFCWLTPGALADPGFLRFHFLEGLAYSMLAQSYLTMIHAACVSAGGRGVLLCGESGSGKSTLAFACASRGWDYIADDASSLVRGDRTRIVLGRPFHIRFRPSAVELFPELRERAGRPPQERQTDHRGCHGEFARGQDRVSDPSRLPRLSQPALFGFPGAGPHFESGRTGSPSRGSAALRPRDQGTAGSPLPGSHGGRHV